MIYKNKNDPRYDKLFHGIISYYLISKIDGLMLIWLIKIENRNEAIRLTKMNKLILKVYFKHLHAISIQ